MKLPPFFLLASALLLALPIPSFAKSKSAARAPKSAPLELVRSEYRPGELGQLCDAAMAKTKERLDAVVAIPVAERNIDNTLLAEEAIFADFSNDMSPLTFMNSVSTNPEISKEASKCSERVGEFSVNMSTRRDLYESILNAKPRNAAEKRLLSETIKGYELSGLKLPEPELEKLKKLMTELSTVEVQFSTNLNEDKSFVAFTAEELDGLSESVLARFKKQDDGKFIVTTKETDYSQLIQNAKRSDTRKKMAVQYNLRGGEENVKLLERAILLREQIAKALGFATWADYQTVNRMAKNGKTALDFLNGLKSKLAQRNRTDLDKLLAFKKELDPSAKILDAWDTGYLAYQLQKRDFNLDNEKIREYFPADVVINGMFSIYSKMLGVDFHRVKDAKVWAPGVQLYAINDHASKKLIGYFYTDFFPRPGKYGHAAAFTLAKGRRLPDGSYKQTVSAIVSNFTAPADGKPSLLTHDEVETAFHEFGHIMHQTLTKAPYASLSGSSVARDFVEAPSQMLENWVWNPKVLGMVSSHYRTKEKLPQELLKQMLAARNFNQGVFYTRQLLLGLFDMNIHTQDGAVETVPTYEKLYREIAGLEPLLGTRFPGTFGHLMGGYDAGYYGYLWSKVYAQDMFTVFNEKDLTSSVAGMKYRKVILEQGAMKEPGELLKEFLGREPRQDAFFKELGI